MCIFCGGQCGVAEFLISIGLPFLGLYFYRIRNSLIQIKNKIFRRGFSAAVVPDKKIKCTCGGELLKDWGAIAPPSIAPQDLELIEYKPQDNETVEKLAGTTKFSNPLKLEKKEEPKGVRGWLLLLCLNLIILIPASYLYEVISILYLINSPMNQIILISPNNFLLYHKIILGLIAFLATFSFYAGLQLWEMKLWAVKLTKIFLIIQLFLSSIIAVIQSFMTFPFVGNENNYIIILKITIPSLLHTSIWYLYLSNSRRVHNTYREGRGLNSSLSFRSSILNAGLSDYFSRKS